MFDSSLLSQIPDRIGVYAFYRRSRPNGKMTCAYVGTAGGVNTKAGVRTRLRQHLVEQTSTTCSRRNPAGVFIERLTHVYVWLDDAIQTKEDAQAAELLLMRKYKPLLRTEGGITPGARARAKQPAFRQRMKLLFRKPTHVIDLPGLDNTAMLTADLLRRVKLLEERVKALEDKG